MAGIQVTHNTVVIGGPTASGKSALAVQLAKQHNGEIVCADSRQVYTGMTLGTASPTIQEQQGIPHHGYGIRNPCESYHVAQFVRDTDNYIQAILQRNRLAILVGGTGLYLRSWRFGIDPAPAADPSLRRHPGLLGLLSRPLFLQKSIRFLVDSVPVQSYSSKWRA